MFIFYDNLKIQFNFKGVFIMDINTDIVEKVNTDNLEDLENDIQSLDDLDEYLYCVHSFLSKMINELEHIDNGKELYRNSFYEDLGGHEKFFDNFVEIRDIIDNLKLSNTIDYLINVKECLEDEIESEEEHNNFLRSPEKTGRI